MTVVNIMLSLPDDLAREAQAQGLLDAAVLEQLIRAELSRRTNQGLRDMLDQLSALDAPPLTDDELRDEVRAARAERRGWNAPVTRLDLP